MDFFTTKIKVLIILFLIATFTGLVATAVHRRTKKRVEPKNSPAYQFPVQDLHQFELANGMRLLVFKSMLVPKVLLQIAYDIGSCVEESGERGLAHLIEHMIFKGTLKLSETDIDAISRKYGASLNAFTSWDMTSYYFETNKDNWRPFMGILADCMQNARFDDQHLASEVKAVIQEMKMIKDDYSRAMIFKSIQSLFSSNHPYHSPLIGHKEDLLGLTGENLKAFYKKYYNPERATLFVVGDVDVEEVHALAKSHFEAITVGPHATIPAKFPEHVQELTCNYTKMYEDVSREQLILYWQIPGLKNGDDVLPDAIEYLLGGGNSGRLVRLLVDEEKVAASVGVSACALMEGGAFLLLIEPLEGKKEECIELVNEELEELGKVGLTQEEKERVAKNQLVPFFLKLQHPNAFASQWIHTYFATRKVDYIFKRLEKFSALTDEEYKGYVQKYLDPFLMHRMEVVPVPAEKRLLKEAANKASDQLDKAILAKKQRQSKIEEPRFALTFADPQPFSFTFPKPEKITHLANGLKVLLLSHTKSPLISMNCRFIHADFFEESREGFALRLMMNMLIEKSVSYSKDDNVNFFEQRGALYSFDAQGAHLVCLKEDFSVLVERVCHILRYPEFSKDALNKLKAIMIDSLQRDQDEPYSIASRLLKNEVYAQHPYAWTHKEVIDDIKALTVKDMKVLHDKYLCSAQLEIAAVGNFECDDFVKVLDKHFGSLPIGEAFERPEVTTKYVQKDTDFPMMRDQQCFILGQSSPLTIAHPDMIPLKLLNIIAFGSIGSRMYQVREQTGLFYRAGGAVAQGATLEHGYDILMMLVSPDRSAEAEKAAHTLFDTLASKGITEEELKSAKQIILKNLIDMVASDLSVAKVFCMLDSFHLGFDYYDTMLKRIQELTVDDVNAIAKKYFVYKNMSRIRVGALSDDKTKDETEQ